jgi:hypothetical protein
MKKPNIIKPTGLKGNDKLNRMRELMGAAPINEGITRSVIELTKEGPDGNIYAIVRENHEYFIKVSNKKSNLVVEDFQYIGGLQNKKDKVYPSYAKAIKQLNLKFMSLNEAVGKSGQINVFVDDNLITEHHPLKADQKLSATKGMGDGAEYVVDKKGKELSYDAKEGKEEDGFGDNVADSTAEKDIEKVKLSENEELIDRMITGEPVVSAKQNGDKSYSVKYSDGTERKVAVSNDDWDDLNSKYGDIKESKKGFSIAKAIEEMDSVIDSITTKESKIDSILESLGEEERAIMIEALKKKV